MSRHILSYSLPSLGAHHAGGGDGGISVGEGSTLDGGASIDTFEEMVSNATMAGGSGMMGTMAGTSRVPSSFLTSNSQFK